MAATSGPGAGGGRRHGPLLHKRNASGRRRFDPVFVPFPITS